MQLAYTDESVRNSWQLCNDPDPTVRRIKILFVDDEDNDVALACRVLARDGLDFEWRRVGDESGLRTALSDFEPDVVICDYNIPGYGGDAAIELVHSMRPDTPVLLVSGCLCESAAIEHLRTGAADYLLKSNLQRLGPAVRRAVADAENRARAREAEQSRHRLAEILEASNDIVVISDPNGRVTFVNDAACRLFHQSSEQLLGTDWAQRFGGRPSGATPNEILSCAIRQGRWHGETTAITADGIEIPISQVVTAHFGAHGETRCFSAVGRDLSDRKSFEARIHELLHRDLLTGLPNLTGMKAAFADLVRRTANRPVSIVIINLDEFHLVDEALGRALSDALLVEIGNTIEAVIGEDATVGRIGPDEFMVFLAGLRLSAAQKQLPGILAAIGVPRRLGGREVQITASAGVAVFPVNGRDLDSLQRKARVAMRESKTRGPGEWLHHARGSERNAKRRLLLESALRGALQRQEISVVYQPQYETSSGTACGVEALARWNRTDGEVVMPSVFVPLAEQINLISSIGSWVLKEACNTVSGWNKAARFQSVVCVNVSARQIGTGFCGTVCRILEAACLAPAQLELEITESMLIDDTESALERLAQLKALGVRIAVDDFGTGYSGLSYLSRLPMDRLKIDKSLVDGLMSEPKNMAIVQAVIELGHKCGFVVLAEGVETEEQFALLRGLGCEQVQGFLFSRPVRAPEARQLMSRQWGWADNVLRNLAPGVVRSAAHDG
jgi:diguanylate cyclase (GGDEF)-like protein/PAS domain S-box-containing protein